MLARFDLVPGELSLLVALSHQFEHLVAKKSVDGFHFFLSAHSPSRLSLLRPQNLIITFPESSVAGLCSNLHRFTVLGHALVLELVARRTTFPVEFTVHALGVEFRTQTLNVVGTDNFLLF